MKRFLSSGLAGAVFLAAGAARAQQPPPGYPVQPGPGYPAQPPPPQAEPKKDKTFDEYFTIGVGPAGAFGAVFLSKVDPQNRNYPDRNNPAVRHDTDTYPGFSGSSLGGGLAIDMRIIDYIGIELDIFYAKQRGAGELKLNNQATNMHMGEGSIHVPLLFKAVLAGKVVSPSLFIGPEFVFPGDPQLEDTLSGVGIPKFTSSNSKYTMMAFGLGIEFRLPLELKYVDICIPISLRGGYHGVGSNLDPDRATYVGTGPDFTSISSIDYKSNWEWQALGTFGLTVHILPSYF